MKLFIAIVLTIFAFSVFAITIKKNVSLDQNCTGYLKRASDANRVETAREELQKSIQYLETNNLTKGYTSVLYKTPDEDIEFWYKNLKASENELSMVSDTASILEKTNLLMKLKETLMDSGEKNDNVTVPEGLSRYPNNLMWGIFIWLAILILLSLFMWGAISVDKNSRKMKAKDTVIK
ncbi:MAG: hypothetical protein ABI266_03545 [Ginsengibacter sp.]